MINLQVPAINGKFLYYAFLSGGNQILNNQTDINRINVFPVNDKDTGTNLASTVRAVIDNIKPYKSYKRTLNKIGEAALLGARGNSGVIFAQFLYGLSQETINKPSISITEFIESVKKSIPYIYEAVANPVEGTMLTIIKDWSDFLSSKKEGIHDFNTTIVDSLHKLEKSLKETTLKLEVLKKSGFVDAGAKGFVLFIRGVIDFIVNKNIRKLKVQAIEDISLLHNEQLTESKIQFRFCTEAIIKDLKVDLKSLKSILNKKGDSIVLAGSNNICRLHIHTNHPASIFQKLREFGTITFQKVDDMIRQQETVFRRKWNIALVTDSTCDLSQELIDKYQINIVPLNLYFGENHYLDKVTIQPDHFYEMLDSQREFPTTSQINEQAFTNVYSHLASHYDAIIAIHLTSKFSGTFNSSVKAAKRISKEFGKPVSVIDSKNLSGALGLLVLKAAQKIEQGLSVEEIVKAIQDSVSDTKIFVSVQNLKSMIRGGRVSKPKGMLATLLGLNPVISMDEQGKSQLFGNTFSQKSSLNKIYSHIQKNDKKKPIWNYIVLHANNIEGANEVRNRMLQIANKEPVSVINISPVIGMHAGNGAVAVSLMYD